MFVRHSEVCGFVRENKACLFVRENEACVIVRENEACVFVRENEACGFTLCVFGLMSDLQGSRCLVVRVGATTKWIQHGTVLADR